LSDFYTRKNAKPNDENSKKALNPRELLIENFFLPFICNYLMGLPHGLSFMANDKMEEQLLAAGLEVKSDNSFDMSKLTKEQYLAVRYHFGECWNNNSLVWS